MQVSRFVYGLCVFAFIVISLSNAPAAEPAGPLMLHLQLDATKANPRNSEGAFIHLKDGRLLFIYSHFTGGTADEAAADLVGRFSNDGGITWDVDAFQVVPREGKMNVMSASLLRLADGRIALFYLVKNSSSDCRLYLRTSSDETRTWRGPTLCMQEEGYFVVNNDRVIQLQGGRLVVPTARHHYAATPTTRPTGRGEVTCFLSDNSGKTWRACSTTLEAPASSRAGFQEPAVVELADSRLLMLIRTDLGYQYQSISADGGQTWSPAIAGELASPLSPASVKRIPGSRDLMVIWNDHRHIAPALRNARTPLSVAMSKDDGKTWSESKTLRDDPHGHYCYTAMQFIDDRVLIAFGGLNGKPLEVGSFELKWLRDGL
jgi:sialidase-1